MRNSKKTALSIVGTAEASSELAAGIGEYFKNRLNLASYIVVGLSEDRGKLEFSLEGSTQDLGTLLRAMVRMAPPSVQKAFLKEELIVQHKEAEKAINDM